MAVTGLLGFSMAARETRAPRNGWRMVAQWTGTCALRNAVWRARDIVMPGRPPTVLSLPSLPDFASHPLALTDYGGDVALD
jgi:hypothetical protein